MIQSGRGLGIVVAGWSRVGGGLVAGCWRFAGRCGRSFAARPVLGYPHEMTAATSTPALWATVPCKGRLAFTQQTAPSVLAQDMGYCLVDFYCPDRCGDWLERSFASAIARGRAIVVRAGERRHFHKAAAHNLGARRAIAAGAQHLVFLDADTLCRPGLAAWLTSRLEQERFWIAGLDADGWERAALVGVLALPALVFQRSGGFDEAFRDWGAEDLEYRLRLHLGLGLDFGEIPVELLHGLPHDDELRVRHYEIKDLERSHLRNQVYMARKLRRELGVGLGALGPRAQRLIRRIRRAAAPDAVEVAR